MSTTVSLASSMETAAIALKEGGYKANVVVEGLERRDYDEASFKPFLTFVQDAASKGSWAPSGRSCLSATDSRWGTAGSIIQERITADGGVPENYTLQEWQPGKIGSKESNFVFGPQTDAGTAQVGVEA